MTAMLLNPTIEEVNGTLSRLCEAANRGQRTRTADMRIDSSEWDEASALYRAGGDGVPNAYRQAGQTTVVGVAWYSVGGLRLVRIEATRALAPRSSGGRREALPFGFNTAITHWAKADARAVVLSAPELADVRRELAAAVAADWLDEHGHPAAAVRAWLLRLAAGN